MPPLTDGTEVSIADGDFVDNVLAVQKMHGFMIFHTTWLASFPPPPPSSHNHFLICAGICVTYMKAATVETSYPRKRPNNDRVEAHVPHSLLYHSFPYK